MFFRGALCTAFPSPGSFQKETLWKCSACIISRASRLSPVSNERTVMDENRLLVCTAASPSLPGMFPLLQARPSQLGKTLSWLHLPPFFHTNLVLHSGSAGAVCFSSIAQTTYKRTQTHFREKNSTGDRRKGSPVHFVLINNCHLPGTVKAYCMWVFHFGYVSFRVAFSRLEGFPSLPAPSSLSHSVIPPSFEFVWTGWNVGIVKFTCRQKLLRFALSSSWSHPHQFQKSSNENWALPLLQALRVSMVISCRHTNDAELLFNVSVACHVTELSSFFFFLPFTEHNGYDSLARAQVALRGNGSCFRFH